MKIVLMRFSEALRAGKSETVMFVAKASCLWGQQASSLLFALVPKLQLGNALVREASLRQGLLLETRLDNVQILTAARSLLEAGASKTLAVPKLELGNEGAWSVLAFAPAY
jgi:hypothetical protein